VWKKTTKGVLALSITVSDRVGLFHRHQIRISALVHLLGTWLLPALASTRSAKLVSKSLGCGSVSVAATPVVCQTEHGDEFSEHDPRAINGTTF
jgi:hypothetical protein